MQCELWTASNSLLSWNWYKDKYSELSSNSYSSMSRTYCLSGLNIWFILTLDIKG